ncbi:MAG: hypothetical protein V4602_15100 [Pseudomonadota bacterium]
MTAELAKEGTDVSVGSYRRGWRLNDAVMRKSREVFPVKTALYLADETGYSVRACERWLAGDAVIPSDGLASLLHSERGRDFLAAVMTEQTPRWWLQLKAFFAAIDLATAQRIHRRKMKALLDDEHASQVPASLFIQDEEFAAGQPAPASTMVRRSRR